MRHVVEATASECFMPLTVGGGLRNLEDIRKMLHSGADKVSLNTAAINDPSLISKLLGNSVISASCWPSTPSVMAIAGLYSPMEDAILLPRAIEWAKKGVSLGAGEILLTSMDADGTLAGYDCELTRRISEAVEVPVIASGGAGNLDH